MKVHFDGVNLSSRSGPNTFAVRLLKQLLTTGIDVVDRGQDADVSLVFIEPSGQPLAKKVVQRLDGIWFKPNEFETKNQRILELYRSADGVVWQSNFDKGMTTRWWGLPKNGTTIMNGVEHFNIDVPESLIELRKSYDQVFVSSANWHPQKRLRANIECFSQLLKSNPNSMMIVMGLNPDCYVSSPHVRYTGSLSHEDCLKIFSIADWMIHLAWLDHCPNVVVEALSMGVPVICSSSGGTCELVGDKGVIIPEASEYQFELADYDKPPVINVNNVTLPDKASLGACADVTIERAARQYVEFFDTL